MSTVNHAPYILDFDDLQKARDLDLGSTDWMRIEQSRIDGFAEATDDHQWVHTDRAAAAAGPFGTTIAHGYLTLSLLSHLLAGLLTISDETRATNYGLDKVRFISPVPEGSEIRLSAILREADLRPDGGVRYRIEATLEIRGQQRPALFAESILLSYREQAP